MKRPPSFIGSCVNHPRLTFLLAIAALWFAGQVAAPGAGAPARQGVAATVHPLATEAALETMRNGGNAIDAAVAAALTLGVVDAHNSGLGGGCFFLVRLADDSVAAIDGRETAPAAATRDMFVRDGKADTQASQLGARAIAVPGALAAYDEACRKFGKLPLRTHLEMAARVAENGFNVTRTYAQRLRATAAQLGQFPGASEALLRKDGAPYEEGDLLRLPDLARSYRSLAREGLPWFYGGAFAEATERWMKTNNGLLTAQDFAAYQVKLREPIRTTYRGCEILGFPPPSSGGVHVAQILNILEHFELKKWKAGSANFIHVVTEAMKLAFADRAYWLGDPDFAAVPRGLVSKSYAGTLARRIDLKRASAVPDHGVPEGSTEDLFEKHTTHFSTADAEGNWVACTATINTTFGAKVVIPGMGIVMNNEMDDFSIQPGVRNHFGLIGGEANAVAPGKRPLSSMSPTVVLKNGKPILSVGAAGGPTIISQTLLMILYTVDYGMSPSAAIAAARFHHQWQPDELQIERAVPEKVRVELAKRGHHLKLMDAIGVTQAVGVAEKDSGFVGVADPRAEGVAAGF